MYNKNYRQESVINLLFTMIKKQVKMPKNVKYKLSEYKLNDVRRTMYDLEHLKLSPAIALNLEALKSIDNELLELKKNERNIIKYRLKA